MTQENHHNRISIAVFYAIGFGTGWGITKTTIPEWLLALYLIGFIIVTVTLMYTYYLNYSRRSPK